MQRPLGVTILAVLALIGGVLAILGGIAFLGAGALVSTPTGQAAVANSPDVNTTLPYIFGLGVFSLVLGVANLVFGIGALQLKRWAWTLGVVLGILNIAEAAISLFAHGNAINEVSSIVINVIILVYLFTPHIQAAFHRSSAALA